MPMITRQEAGAVLLTGWDANLQPLVLLSPLGSAQGRNARPPSFQQNVDHSTLGSAQAFQPEINITAPTV